MLQKDGKALTRAEAPLERDLGSGGAAALSNAATPSLLPNERCCLLMVGATVRGFPGNCGAGPSSVQAATSWARRGALEKVIPELALGAVVDGPADENTSIPSSPPRMPTGSRAGGCNPWRRHLGQGEKRSVRGQRHVHSWQPQENGLAAASALLARVMSGHALASEQTSSVRALSRVRAHASPASRANECCILCRA